MVGKSRLREAGQAICSCKQPEKLMYALREATHRQKVQLKVASSQ